jgi:hypothetical protein
MDMDGRKLLAFWMVSGVMFMAAGMASQHPALVGVGVSYVVIGLFAVKKCERDDVDRSQKSDRRSKAKRTAPQAEES